MLTPMSARPVTAPRKRLEMLGVPVSNTLRAAGFIPLGKRSAERRMGIDQVLARRVGQNDVSIRILLEDGLG